MKGNMNDFVVYDVYDNLIGYFEDLDELSRFFNRKKNSLKYRLSRQDIVEVQDDKVYKIYKVEV